MSSGSDSSSSPCSPGLCSVSGSIAFPSKSSARLLGLLMKIQTVAQMHHSSCAGNNNRDGSSPAIDFKPYVDIPLKRPVAEADAAFDALPQQPDGTISSDTLLSFLIEYFDDAGSDIDYSRPEDYEPRPSGFLTRVNNPTVMNWALEVHSKWLELSRKTSAQVTLHPDQHTLLRLKWPFVVPGSRFREVYYWDSFWVIKGLIVSKMFTTAKRIVLNLLDLVDSYGFVPNGARTYYGNRSQPPLLSEMVKMIYIATGENKDEDEGEDDEGEDWLESCMPRLIAEHSFWTSSPHLVRISKNNVTYELSRYYALWAVPRPESYAIDIETASQVPKSARSQLYLDIASGAESGWDFSSRWMADGKTLQTLRTTKIVPADLNAYLFQMEGNLASFAKILGKEAVAAQFTAAQARRKAAIDAILWNESKSQWFDYWLSDHTYTDACRRHRVEVFYLGGQNQKSLASNFIPLWAGLNNNDDHDCLKNEEMRILRTERIIIALKNSGLVQPAGIATSDVATTEQWDFPNGWAPLQHMIIDGLSASKSATGLALARDLARRWLRTNYAAYQRTGTMHEKYDVRTCGKFGGGGEYEPQTGFGWSNGVVLTLLEQFGWDESTDIA